MGLGFLHLKRGTFRYIDRIGPAAIVSQLEKLVFEFGERFQPCPIFHRLVDADERIYDRYVGESQDEQEPTKEEPGAVT